MEQAEELPSDCSNDDTDCILNDGEVRRILSRTKSTKLLSYERGESIFEKGEMVVGFYIICRGMVKEVSHPSIGKNITLEIFSPGDLLASDSFFLDEEWYETSARAITEADILFLKREFFPKLMEVASEKVGRKLARNMRYLRKNIELSSCPVLEKLAYWLAKLFPDSSNQFTISNKELAEIVGCSHVTVSKKLSQLEEEGLLRKEGQDIIVPDKEVLRKRAACADQ